MLTISKALSSGQAQRYHAEEFQNGRENYYADGERITGTWHGTRVAATYSRVNGCQVQRWDKIGKVLGPINPGGPMIPAPG